MDLERTPPVESIHTYLDLLVLKMVRRRAPLLCHGTALLVQGHIFQQLKSRQSIVGVLRVGNRSHIRRIRDSSRGGHDCGCINKLGGGLVLLWWRRLGQNIDVMKLKTQKQQGMSLERGEEWVDGRVLYFGGGGGHDKKLKGLAWADREMQGSFLFW